MALYTAAAMARVDDRYFNVTKHGSLRTPGVLWLAMAFLMRHLLLAGIIFATAKRSPEVVRLLGGNFSWMVLPFELPMLLLMLAGANRAPSGADIWRRIWRRGSLIILAVALFHLAWAGWALATADVWRRWPELFIASCGLLDLAILHGVWKDTYYRDLFADFPPPATKSPPP